MRRQRYEYSAAPSVCLKRTRRPNHLKASVAARNHVLSPQPALARLAQRGTCHDSCERRRVRKGVKASSLLLRAPFSPVPACSAVCIRKRRRTQKSSTAHRIRSEGSTRYCGSQGSKSRYAAIASVRSVLKLLQNMPPFAKTTPGRGGHL